jgi:phosphatidylglycerol:prolipoprotein diacylglycerol transferase
MAPVIHVFGVSLQTYPLAILGAVAAALWLAARGAGKSGMDQNQIYDLGFYALLATLLGARVTYAMLHWSAYLQTPLAVLSLTPTALYWPGGALVGVAAAILYGWRHSMPLGRTLDALAPGIALGLAIERLGAFLGGVGLGAPTSLPWGVPILDVTRHPVQLLEMALLLGIAVWLWRSLGQGADPGGSFVRFVALYAGQRLFAEAFRAQTPLLPNGLRVVQLIALPLALGAVGILYYRRFLHTASQPASEDERVD